MGKTALLRHLSDADGHCLYVNLSQDDPESLRMQLAAVTGLAPGTSLIGIARHLDNSEGVRGVLIDNAHRLVRPTLGGLQVFDDVVALVSKHCEHVNWMFSLDAITWQFLERARDVRPLFDEVAQLQPWREEEIVTLLRNRSERAKIRPNFDHLIDQLPPNADEIDKYEAVTRQAAGYYRILWDYAGGNPGVALIAVSSSRRVSKSLWKRLTEVMNLTWVATI
jgi:hypothetical protein